MNVISIRNFISSSSSGTVINYGSGFDFLTSYCSSFGSGSTCQKVTVPTVPVPVPQHWLDVQRLFCKSVSTLELESKKAFLLSVQDRINLPAVIQAGQTFLPVVGAPGTVM
jgi:hypothetical protein